MSRALSPREVEALAVALKIERSGYGSLTPREQWIAAFLLTPGGCSSCGR